MGAVGSKSPLERRNTVLRRSQRKSIHATKSKADRIIKDIKKFKETEENSTYIDLKARIETAERELRVQTKSLQPQTRHIYNETVKKTELCYKLLDDKLKENQAKQKEKLDKQPIEEKQEVEDKDSDDDVFVEEVKEEENELEETAENRKTVQLNVIQVEQIEASPQINKRFSAMKLGVPVMPGSMMESLNRRTHDMNLKSEEKIAQIRKEIEKLEIEISQFVGRRNGRFYNVLIGKLDEYSDELKNVPANDEAIAEQVKLCSNYIMSCASFLNEKAVDDDVDGDDDYDDVENVTNRLEPKTDEGVDTNLSPRSMRTTYI